MSRPQQHESPVCHDSKRLHSTSASDCVRIRCLRNRFAFCHCGRKGPLASWWRANEGTPGSGTPGLARQDQIARWRTGGIYGRLGMEHEASASRRGPRPGAPMAQTGEGPGGVNPASLNTLATGKLKAMLNSPRVEPTSCVRGGRCVFLFVHESKM